MKEKYYEIHYGCGCGENEDYIRAMSEESAMEIAYEAAIEDYESYEGLHGIRGIEDIAEEDYDVDYGEIPETLYDQIYADYLDEREGQLSYWVVEISYHDYLVGVGEISEDEALEAAAEDAHNNLIRALIEAGGEMREAKELLARALEMLYLLGYDSSFTNPAIDTLTNDIKKFLEDEE